MNPRAYLMAGVLLSAPARGAPAASLQYLAEEGCPPEGAFRNEVAERLGADPFHGDAPQISVRARQSGASFEAIVTLPRPDGTRGERSFSSARCQEAVHLAALAVSVLLEEPREGVKADDPPPAPGPELSVERWDNPVPELKILRDPIPAQAVVPAEHHFRGGLHLRPGVAVGAVPEVTPTGELTFDVGRDSWSLEIGARAFLSGSKQVPGSEGHVEGTALSLLTAPCYEPWTYLRSCVRADVGVFQGTSSGFDVQKTEWALFAAVGPRVVGVLPIGQFSLELGADAGVSLVKAALGVGERAVWRTPPVWGAIWAGGAIDLF